MTTEVEKRLAKAGDSIEAGLRLLSDDYFGFAASRGYYAMFYVAESLLATKGLRFKKHSGVHSAFGEHFAKTALLDSQYHRWLLEAFGARIEGDYGLDVKIRKEDAQTILQRASEFLATARAFLNIPA